MQTYGLSLRIGCRSVARTVAFTLVEMLVVLAIVAVLAAIIFPVVSSARLSAKKAATISNLKQCGLALAIYYDDYSELPDRNSVYEALSKAPICDGNDPWLGNRCPQRDWNPLVGSYGYVRSTEAYNDLGNWHQLLEQNANPMVMASIHYATYPVAPFKGDHPDYRSSECRLNKACIMPDVVISLYLDTSAKRFASSTFSENQSGGQAILMNWGSLFDRGWILK